MVSRKILGNDMKIGLVLFGHLRSFRSSFDSYKNFLETLKQIGDVDVFCHTWDIEESVTASWWKEQQPGSIPPANVNADEFTGMYKPVRSIIEPSKQFNDTGYDVISAIPVAGILSMLHSQQQAYQLSEQYSGEKNIQYDVVIKSRYDLLYEIAPGFDNTIKNAATNKIVYLPSSNAYELAGSFSDVLAIGNAATMKDYFSFCSSFTKAINIYKEKGYTQFLPELCMTVYLNSLHMKIAELTDLRLHILRLNGEKFQINSVKDFPGNHPLCFIKQIIEKNKGLVSEPEKITNQIQVLVKKYTSWIDTDADELQLKEYVNFFIGKKVSNKVVQRLAEKEKSKSVFNFIVFRNFFETAIRAAGYGTIKKISVVVVLYLFSRYGIFFFRVWKRLTFNKK